MSVAWLLVIFLHSLSSGAAFCPPFRTTNTNKSIVNLPSNPRGSILETTSTALQYRNVLEAGETSTFLGESSSLQSWDNAYYMNDCTGQRTTRHRNNFRVPFRYEHPRRENDPLRVVGPPISVGMQSGMQDALVNQRKSYTTKTRSTSAAIQNTTPMRTNSMMASVMQYLLGAVQPFLSIRIFTNLGFSSSGSLAVTLVLLPGLHAAKRMLLQRA